MREMSKQKTIWTLLDDITKFNDEYFPNWRNQNPIYYSNAMAGETGEVCNLVKKYLGGGTNRNHIPTKEEIVMEIIDSLIYGSLLSGTLGFSTNEFMEIGYKKLDELYERMKNSRKNSRVSK